MSLIKTSCNNKEGKCCISDGTQNCRFVTFDPMKAKQEIEEL